MPKFRMLSELNAHEQTAVRSALDAEVPRAGNLARDEGLGHCGEIVVDSLTMGLQSGLMPSRAEFAAAANIRDDVNAAIAEPEFPERAAVLRCHRNTETAVRVEHRRVAAVVTQVLR